MTREIKILFGVGAVVAGWYFVGLWQTVKHLDWQFSNFKIHKIDKNGLEFRLTLRIDNTTGSRSIHIRGARFKLYMDDYYISTVDLKRKFSVLSGQSKTVEFAINLRWLQFSRLLLDAVSNNTVNISANGVVNVGGISANVPTINLANVNITQEIQAVKDRYFERPTDSRLV